MPSLAELTVVENNLTTASAEAFAAAVGATAGAQALAAAMEKLASLTTLDFSVNGFWKDDVVALVRPGRIIYV